MCNNQYFFLPVQGLELQKVEELYQDAEGDDAAQIAPVLTYLANLTKKGSVAVLGSRYFWECSNVVSWVRFMQNVWSAKSSKLDCWHMP